MTFFLKLFFLDSDVLYKNYVCAAAKRNCVSLLFRTHFTKTDGNKYDF